MPHSKVLSLSIAACVNFRNCFAVIVKCGVDTSNEISAKMEVSTYVSLYSPIMLVCKILMKSGL